MRSSQLIVLIATCLVTSAGGAMDAWTYLTHGRVFANAQTGNIVLMSIAFTQGDVHGAASRIPSLVAFVAGITASRLSGHALKRAGLNSRIVRLGIECGLLLALAAFADRLSDSIATSCVGFIAGLQITSLSHFGRWSFNTAMTTGNLQSAISALINAFTGAPEERDRALAMGAICLAFVAGALLGAWLSPRLAGLTLLPIAGLVALGALLTLRRPDPLPEWGDIGR